MRYIDLFAGIGGFRYGIEEADRAITKQKNILDGRTESDTAGKSQRQDRTEYSVHSSKNEGGRTLPVRNWQSEEGNGEPKTPEPSIQPTKESVLNDRNESGNIGRRNTGQVQCVYSNEWDKYANSVYRRHYEECDQRDIRTVSDKDIPEHDLLCGGFPCQAFSIAGKRRGFDDTRGTLFYEIARILKAKQPRLCLLENVKGLLSHDNGRTFKTIIATLVELRYDIQWQVLNSKDFGVPQNRERVFIIGHTRGTARPEVFPFRRNHDKAPFRPVTASAGRNRSTGSNYVNEIQHEEYEPGVIRRKWTTLKELTQSVSDAQRVYDTSGVAKTLKGLGGGMGAKTGLYAVPERSYSIDANYWKGPDRLDKSRRQVIPVLTPDIKNKSQNGRRMKEDGDPAFTLNAIGPNGVSDGVRIRRLTPRECERLQGFPDDWTKYGVDGETISDTQRYKMAGNAVTTNVVTAIAERLIPA